MSGDEAEVYFGESHVRDIQATLSGRRRGAPEEAREYYGLRNLNNGLRLQDIGRDSSGSGQDDEADSWGDGGSGGGTRRRAEAKRGRKQPAATKERAPRAPKPPKPPREPRLGERMRGAGGEELEYVGANYEMPDAAVAAAAATAPPPPAEAGGQHRKRQRSDGDSQSDSGASQAREDDFSDENDDSDGQAPRRTAGEPQRPPPATAAPEPPKIKHMYVRRRRITAPRRVRINALGAPQPPEKCFGCTHLPQRSALPGCQRIIAMATLFNAQISNADRIVTVRNAAEYYEVEVRSEANKPGALLDGEEPLPEWNAATIWEHFMNHMNDFGLRRGERLDMINEIINHIYSYDLWREVETEPGSNVFRTELDPVALSRLERYMKLDGQLYAQDPRRAMFSTSGVGMPTDEARSIIKSGRVRLRAGNVAEISGTSKDANGNRAGVGSTIFAAGALDTSASRHRNVYVGAHSASGGSGWGGRH